jgi:hypothetical protein
MRSLPPPTSSAGLTYDTEGGDVTFWAEGNNAEDRTERDGAETMETGLADIQ